MYIGRDHSKFLNFIKAKLSKLETMATITKISAVFILLCIQIIAFAQSIQKNINAIDQVLVADSLFEAGNFEASIKKIDEANVQFSKAKNAKALYYNAHKICLNNLRLGKYDEVQVFALEQINSLAQNTELKDFFKPLFLSVLGEVQLIKGRTDKALEFYNQALASASEKVAEIDEIYSRIGVANWVNGNADLALEFHIKALNYRKQYYGEMHIKTAAIYNNIGLTYSRTEPNKALEYYAKALEIYIGKYKNGNQPSLAIIYSNVGYIYSQQKDYNKALDNFEQALNIWTKIYTGSHPSVAFIYSNLGQIFLQRNSFAKAETNLNLALDIYLKYFGNKYPDVASTYNQLGNLYEKQNKDKTALSYFQKAIIANSQNFGSENPYLNPSSSDYYDPNIMLTSLTLKARALENIHFQHTLKRRDLKMALACLETADTLLDRIRQSRTSKADKIALGALASEVYENGIKLSLDLADVSLSSKAWNKKAFYFNEKSKAAVLLESISETQAKNFAGIPDSLLEKENQLKADISFFEQKLAENANNAKMDKFYRDKLFALNRNFEMFTKRLEANFPEYYNLKFNVNISQVADIQKHLDKETALISYFNAENNKRIYVFVITKNKLKVVNSDKNPEFEKLLIGYRNSIIYQSTETYFNTAYALYQQLIPKSLKVSNLIIVPDGKLGTIPFEALLSKKYTYKQTDLTTLKYLVSKYNCSYEFSGTLFSQTQFTNSNTLSKSILFCAPVNFSTQFQSKNMADLPATENEVKEIGLLFNNKKYETTTYIGNTASEAVVKSDNLKNYGFLHFATHGIVNEAKPELSKIYLNSDKAKNEDGNLYSGEIYNLKIKADLVTLSACQTGLGKITKGEGIIGLSRALLFAGAKNIIVSQWTVNDLSTSELMVDFYDTMLSSEKRNYSFSLKKAKLQLISNPKTANPYYWAPFVLIGK